MYLPRAPEGDKMALPKGPMGLLASLAYGECTYGRTKIALYVYRFKDHKEGESWPVVLGCTSNTLGLSNLL